MRVASALATLIAAGALAAVIAYWGWQIFAPAVVYVPASSPVNPAATIIAADLFAGGANASTTTVAPGDAVLGGDTRLLGTIAEAQRGYALFRLPSGPKLVEQGGEIAPGATLVSVQRDAITVRDGAGERRFVLRSDPRAATRETGRPAATAARNAATATPMRSTAIASCGPPAGFKGSVVRLNTELLGDLAGDAAPWRTLLAASNPGLVVRESGGFGAMLGLRAGDRLAQANGIALSVPDDVTSAVIRPLLQNQGVRIVGSRAGTTQELWLANVACAG